MMEKVISRKEVLAALEAANVFEGEDAIVPAYRGGWDLPEGFGIEFDAMSHVFAFFTSLGIEGGVMDQYADDNDDESLTSERAFELARAGRMSALTSHTVVYFPGWTLV
jgi:hypothetical protein